MDLVDIDDVVAGFLRDAFHHLLDTFLEVATELGTSQQRAEVELVDLAAFQTCWYIPAVLDIRGQSVDECRLTHTRLSDMQRVVFLLATEHLDGALQLLFPSYQRVVLLVGVVQAGDEFPPRLLLI